MRLNETLVIRYPLLVRVVSSLPCFVVAGAIIKGSIHATTIVVFVGALCLSVAVLAYRAEVSATEVRIRYLPFYTRHTPMRDITHFIEKNTLVLVTATSQIPLWGLSLKARQPLFELLPKHLETAPTHPTRTTDSAAVVLRHVRRTILIAAAFVVTVTFSVPFLHGNPWNAYVDTFGKYVIFACLCAFLLLLFQAGFTYVLWSSKRTFDRIERDRPHRRG